MEEKLLKEKLGKKVTIYYNDTPNSVSCKKGTLLDFDKSNLKIQEENKSRPTLLPRDKYIRMEGIN